MKKLFLLCSAAIVGCLAFTSCNKAADNSGSDELECAIDSVSYALGAMQGSGITSDVLESMQLDSSYTDDFIRGIEDGLKDLSDAEKAHALGMFFAVQINSAMLDNFNQRLQELDSTVTIDDQIFIDAFLTAAKNEDLKIGGFEAEQYMNTFAHRAQIKKNEQEYGDNKKAGQAWLDSLKADKDVQTTASGLQYKIIKQGNGPKPGITDTVVVNYKGTLIDGYEFDSSYNRKEPAEFPVNAVIPGWTEGLQLMSAGTTCELYIPYELAYGADGDQFGRIKPFSALKFVVELVKVKPAVKQAAPDAAEASQLLMGK